MYIYSERYIDNQLLTHHGFQIIAKSECKEIFSKWFISDTNGAITICVRLVQTTAAAANTGSDKEAKCNEIQYTYKHGQVIYTHDQIDAQMQVHLPS